LMLFKRTNSIRKYIPYAVVLVRNRILASIAYSSNAYIFDENDHYQQHDKEAKKKKREAKRGSTHNADSCREEKGESRQDVVCR